MKTGVLLEDMSASDKNYHIMKSLNDYVDAKRDEVFGFIMNVSRKVIPTHFAYSNCAEVANFQNAVLIATCLETADVLVKTSVKSKKCFYVWSLEWLNQPYNYIGLKTLLSDKSLRIIARSQLLADIIKNNYDVVVDGIDEDFNLENINGICKKE
jgi:hypothetical protein